MRPVYKKTTQLVLSAVPSRLIPFRHQDHLAILLPYTKSQMDQNVDEDLSMYVLTVIFSYVISYNLCV